MMPYRTNENLINGVVITFINITEIKRSNEEFRLLHHLQSLTVLRAFLLPRSSR